VAPGFGRMSMLITSCVAILEFLGVTDLTAKELGFVRAYSRYVRALVVEINPRVNVPGNIEMM